jgi:bacillithiol biosynthesis deacetylase BshB1
MKLDILAIAAHPDDIELCCAGTLLKHIEAGYSVGLVDLTQGELGTRGNATLRLQEAENAAQKMGAEVRINLGMPDGFFDHSLHNKRKIVEVVREFQPNIVLTNAVDDRHPDHGRASKLISDACFLAGLSKFQTLRNGVLQERWRPKSVYHFIQDRYSKPDFVIDITDHMEKKMDLVMTFKSQFFNPDSPEPKSPISGKDFLDFLYARAREYGRALGVEYAEGFTVERTAGVESLFDLV